VCSSDLYSLDGFAIATIKFARILKSLGHTVFLYASEENEGPCDELISVITKEEQETALAGSPYQYAAFNEKTVLWQLGNQRAINEIAKRKQAHDFICSIGGTAQKPIADAHPDLMFVEYSIGYISSFSHYRVFESEAWRHCTHGFQNGQDGIHFWDTIPYFFDPEQFEASRRKEEFAVYVGRVTPKKGIGVACRAAELAHIPLYVIGHGDPSLVTNGAQYLGALSDDERNDWLARASVFICPTLYLEPFGAMAVEAQLSGTPVVCTPFGAFTETVEEGRTGYHCHIMRDYVRALADAPLLDSRYIRDRATRLYSLETAARAYQKYFERLMLLWTTGFETVDTPEIAEAAQ
jgi:glycosyltransferase involved in cell wall biosynthesis